MTSSEPMVDAKPKKRREPRTLEQLRIADELSLDEAARLKGVDKKTIKRRIKAKRLTAYRDGHQIVRVKRVDLDRLFTATAEPTTAESATKGDA